MLKLVSFLLVLLQTVQQRGAAVIKARKLSSAMSAAKAICDHMRDIWFGTKEVSVDSSIFCAPLSFHQRSVANSDVHLVTNFTRVSLKSLHIYFHLFSRNVLVCVCCCVRRVGQISLEPRVEFYRNFQKVIIRCTTVNPVQDGCRS